MCKCVNNVELNLTKHHLSKLELTYPYVPVCLNYMFKFGLMLLLLLLCSKQKSV